MRAENKLPSVEVVIFTYNHAPFIEEALRSVECQLYAGGLSVRVHDDASTDETYSVIKDLITDFKIPITVERAKENRYKHGIEFMAEFISLSKADYVAILGGDDYWTDSSKIRRQVDIMEDDTSIALCHHRFSTVWPDGRKIKVMPPIHLQRRKVQGENFLSLNFVGASTAMIRRSDMIYPMPDGFNELVLDDFATWAVITKGKFVGFVSRDMAGYRRHSNNRWATEPDSVKDAEFLKTISWIRNLFSKEDLELAGPLLALNKSNTIESFRQNALTFVLRNFVSGLRACFWALRDRF